MKKDKNLNTASMPKAPVSSTSSGRGGRIFAITFMCFVLIGLSATAIVLMILGNHGGEQKIVYVTNTVEVSSDEQQYAPGSIVINGKDSTGKVIFKNRADLGILCFDFKQFFEFAGASVLINGNTIEVAPSNEIAKVTVDSTIVEVLNKENNTVRNPEIVTAPYADNGNIFFSIEDMSFVFSDISIVHDTETEIWYIDFGKSSAGNQPTADTEQAQN